MTEPKKSLLDGIEEDAHEHYRVTLTEDEFKHMKSLYVRHILLHAAVCFVLLAFTVLLSASQLNTFLLGVECALLILCTAIFATRIYLTHRAWEGSRERVLSTLYDYTVFNGFFVVWISNDNMRQIKLTRGDIKKIRRRGNLLLLETGALLFPLRVSELDRDSLFLKWEEERR